MHPTAMCSAVLGQQSCFYVSRAEYFVSTASASIALMMMVPLVAMFIMDLTLYSLQMSWSYVKPRWAYKPKPFTDIGLTFNSPNVVRKLVANYNLTKARSRFVAYSWLASTRRKD